jgi:hypothetical protein
MRLHGVRPVGDCATGTQCRRDDYSLGNFLI